MEKNPIGFLSRKARAMLTSWLAYKNTSSLHHSIVTAIVSPPVGVVFRV